MEHLMEKEKIIVRDTTVDKAISKGLEQLELGSQDVDIEIISEGKKGLFGFGSKEAVVEMTPKNLPELREPGNIALFENEERADYISENQDEKNLDSDQNNYEYSGTLEHADLDEPENPIPTVTETLVEDEDEGDEYAEEDLDGESGSSREDAIQHVIEYLENVVEVYGASANVSADEKHNLITFNIDTNKAGLIIGKHGKIINSLQTLAQTIFQHHQQRRVSVVVNVGDYRQRRESILENIADRTAERVLRTKQPVFLEPLPAFERKLIHARLSKDDRISTHSEGKEPHRYLVVEIAK